MQIKEAIEKARSWVQTIAQKETGFVGAYLAGSIIQKSFDEVWPIHSDVDIMIVSSNIPELKIGKFMYDGVLLEATHLDSTLFCNKEMILSDYHLSYSFAHTLFLADPENSLTPLQKEVAEDYHKEYWIHRRCQQIKNKINSGLSSIPEEKPFHEQVMGWLFPTSVLTHLFLTAALENPTVRRRYEAVEKVLETYQMEDVYQALLKEINAVSLKKNDVQMSLHDLSDTFDLAAAYAQTPIFFLSDISLSAKSISIEGCQTLIDKNKHRESIFWIIATYCRCHIILATDAPEIHADRLPYFKKTLALIGMYTSEDLFRKAESTKSNLPYFWEKTEQLISIVTKT
ncbi:hypothetical protein [Gracilibacillus alcaliphilus]|uniref:hypothetical protein n=1 Tax=Gracilibacillus alcaliphilus TaxID=1401441 RepID=UPI00195924D0|nr:hypothetical protein [Gracilibacillus alcaliphilus]MBM7675967.1 hypothetical protein [Gracilibacillus alcaliphilus]